MDNNELGTNLAEVGTDCISRQAAIDVLRKLREEDIEDYGCEIPEGFNQDHLDRATFAIKQLPPIQPEITHEQAVEYLQSTGWMREHDLQMMLDGVHRLTVQPEIVRCKDCKYWDTTWQNDYAPNYHYCPMIDGTHRNDFYCADAERREVTT